MSSLILNKLPNIDQYTYLELGIANPANNFLKINCKEKFAVDIDDIVLSITDHGKYHGSTDDYFKQLPSTEKFDIIFIDANHDYDFLLRDFNNAIDHANEWILIHDLVPPTKQHTNPRFCSDSYKLLYYLLRVEDFEMYTTVENYGFTMIKMPAKKVHPSPSYANVLYEEFIDYVNATYKRYTENELISYLVENKKF